MRANVDTRIHTRWEIKRPHMIEKDERPHHALLCKRQYAAHFQAAAEAATPLLNDHFYHFVSPDRTLPSTVLARTKGPSLASNLIGVADRLSCLVRHRRIKQLCLPQQGDTATAAMLLHNVDHPFEGVGSGPITLPLGRHSEPGHHVHSGPDHALNGNLVGLDRNGARHIGHHRHVPTFSSSLDSWHGDADLGPQPGDDQ